VNKRVFARSARGFSLRPRLRVHIEIYLYIEGLPGVSKPEYLEQLRFFNRLLESESGKKE